MKKLWVITTILALCFQGCTSKEEWETGGKNGTKGSVSLKLSQNGDFTVPRAKAENVNVNDFAVKIWQGETLYKSFAKYSDIPSVIEIDPGRIRWKREARRITRRLSASLFITVKKILQCRLEKFLQWIWSVPWPI